MAWKRHKQYRLQGYDYSGEGAYFITIVTKDRAQHFGEIYDGVMQLSPIGCFLEDFIQNFKLHKERIQLEEWQVMPNHVHIILTISPADDSKTHEAAIGLQPLTVDSVSSCINHMKGKVKRWCSENGFFDFQWQARFHDRIIRDAEEYKRILAYVRANPENWNEDMERS